MQKSVINLFSLNFEEEHLNQSGISLTNKVCKSRSRFDKEANNESLDTSGECDYNE